MRYAQEHRRPGFDVLLCCGGLWLAYTPAPQPSKLNVVKLTDDLYVIHNDYVTVNTTALVTNEGVVVVGAKFPQDADNIVSELKKLTSLPIKYVISTIITETTRKVTPGSSS